MQSRRRWTNALLFIPLVMLFLTAGSTTAFAAFSGSGSGTTDAPYIITTPAQLNELRNDRKACYKLGNDIDMGSWGNFTPIGWEASGSYPFYGTFDGDYRTISNLTINKPTGSYVGLFGGMGWSGKGKIMNLRLTNVNVTGRNFVGGLVGQARYGAVVERVYVDGTVTGQFVDDGDLSGYSIGGLIGNMGWYGVATVSECVSKATVTSTSTIAGGLVGCLSRDYDTSIAFVISNSYATGQVSAPVEPGNPDWDRGGAAGGLAGWVEGEITDSYFRGQVTGGSSLSGGIAGGDDPSAEWSSCYTDKAVGESGIGTNKTAAEMKVQATFTGWDFTDDGTPAVWGINAASYPYLRWETRPIMRGSVTVVGTAKNGEELSVNTAGLSYTAAAPGNVLQYQWKRNGAAIGGATGSAYTLVGADVGKKITVVVTADGANAQGRVVSAATAVVAKGDAAAPAAPAMDGDATRSNIALLANSLHEFSRRDLDHPDDPLVWQSSSVFTGLSANTDYTFYARLKATATHNASPASEPAVYSTAPNGIGGTVVITGIAKFDELLTADISGIAYVPALEEGVVDEPAYQWKRDGVPVDGATGTACTTYHTVEADVGKAISVTVIADGVHAAGNVSSAVIIIDKADAPPAPGAPTATDANVTFQSVTLDGNLAYEFSRGDVDGDGIDDWQGGPDGHKFLELTPETQYTFRARVAGTTTHKESLPSAVFTVTTDVRPVIGGSPSITVTAPGDLVYGGTLEVDLTGISYNPATTDDLPDHPYYAWHRSGVEIAGTNGHIYVLGEEDVGRKISVRVYADGSNAEGWVESSPTALVGKAAPLMPAQAPVVDTKTLSSVTLVDNHNAPHQFSKDGGATWQGAVFSNLIPGNTYVFTARVKETAVRVASSVSDSLTVTLDPDTVDPSWALDSAVTAASIGPTQVTLTWTGASDNVAIGSYKVYRDGALIGTTATASYTATGLSPLTSYVFKVEAGDLVDRWTTNGPELTISTTAPEPEEEEEDDEEVVTPPAWLGGEMEVGVRHWTGSEDLEVTAAPGANSYVLEIMTSSLFSVEGEAHLVASTGVGTVSIPSNMLVGTEHASSAAVSLTFGLGDRGTLPEGVKQAVGDRPLIRLSLDVDGRRADWSNPEAPVTVTIPYTPTPEELLNPEAITVWYIDGSGDAIEVPSGRYDSATGAVVFSTTHFSDYAIVFVEKTFSDLDSVPWAKSQVEALASKGIVKGTAGGLAFLPDAEVTRADFVLMLCRTLSLSARDTGSFADVAADAYYRDAVGTAKTLGITDGVDGVNFDPEASITRQDMMALAARALALVGKMDIGVDAAADSSSAGDVLDSFTDAGLVASYAVDSVSALVHKGLVAGDGGRICPLENTTRAEAAVLLHRIYNWQ